MTDGFINVLKPPAMSSHDVVYFIRKTYGIKRVGHAGTLDPAAAGVLPVAVGKATRFLEYIEGCGKAYRAELTFGWETDTGDDTGRVTAARDFALPPRATVEQALASFCGRSLQTPPMYSALKVGGRKLYDLARQGVSVERPAREIEITRIELVHLGDKTMLYDVACSKGTYIRTLCADIGAKLGLLAVMSFLVRTQSASFRLEKALTLEEIAASPAEALQPLDSALQHLSAVFLDAAQAAGFRQGKRLRLASAADGIVRVYDEVCRFSGVGRYAAERQVLHPEKVLLP